MSKWIVIPAAALAIIAIGMADASRAAEPSVIQGAGGHKASGHIEVLKDGAATKVVFKDDFTLQDWNRSQPIQ